MTAGKLKGTRDRAAALRGLLGQIAGAGTPQPGAVRNLPTLLVEATAAMPANATTPVACKILAINGATIEDTRSRINVLNVGPRQIASGTKFHAEPCGRLGYCVSRPSQGVPVVRRELSRYLRFKQLLDNERGDENAAWNWGTFRTLGAQTRAFRINNAVGYYVAYDAAIGSGGQQTYKMQPTRWKIDGFGDMWHGVRGRQQVPTVAPTWERLPPWDAARQNWLESINDTLGPIAFPLSDKLPPALHLSGYRSEGMFFSRGFSDNSTAFYAFVGTDYFSEPSSPTGLPRTLWSGAIENTVTHGRLWLDGADATGIVAITGRAFEAATYGGVSWAADITDNAKTVEVDLWLQAKISILNPSAPGPIDQVGWLDVRPGSMRCVIGSHDRYQLPPVKLTFDANGPGGAAVLNSVGNAGWNTSDNGALRITDLATPYDAAVWLYHDREIPYIVIFKRAVAAAPALGYAFYLPEDTSHYQPLRLPSGNSMIIGKWDPTAATIFRRVAGTVSSPPQPAFTDIHGAGSPAGWDGLYNDFPSTVTVEPYTP